MNRLNVGGMSKYCKKAVVRLDFNNKVLQNPLSLARSSFVGWGPWQSQRKVQTQWGPVWYVTTAGHGGYLLVTQAKVPLFYEPQWAIEHEFGNVYVYEFEEDYNWAILEYYDEKVRESGRLSVLKHLSSEEYLERVKDSLRRWNPEVLAS